MTLLPGRQAKKKGMTQMRVVTDHPVQRGLLVAGVVMICLLGVAGGFWFGGAKAGLDRTYMMSLEGLNQANVAEIDNLKAELVAAALAREVDLQTTAELRETIRSLRDELATVTEEVTFYKSLMAPSSLPRGLQIAEFELLASEVENQFTFHLLLTQVESRRDWIQGDIRVSVRGRDEQVLSLTEIGDAETYPLKFRFRYFQDLSGMITLPAGFEPESIEVVARRRGANAADLSKTFAWMVAEEANREFRS